MKGARTPVGYTIVEVMIVLAISGVMFLMAIDFIGGRQEATSFPQGANQMVTRLQSIIEQVSDGQYSDVDLTCNFTYETTPPPYSYMDPAPGLNTTTSSAAKDFQGTNSPCIFLGKVVQFNTQLTGLAANEQYETFVIAGGRLDNNDQPVTADPNALTTTPLDNDAPTPIAPLTTESTVPQTLSVDAMGLESTAEPIAPITHLLPNNSLIATSYGVGFIQNLGDASQDGGTNGSQPFNLYYVTSLTGPLSPTSAETAINGQALKLVLPTQEIVMCVSDGTQYAYIEIGSGSSQINVNVVMLDRHSCTDI